MRSAAAIVAGLLSMLVVTFALTFLVANLLPVVPGHMTRLWLALTSVCLAAALIGGWIAARVAGHAPVFHGIVLAALMIAFSALNLTHPGPAQPFPYLIGLVVLAPLAAVAGAWMEARVGSLSHR